MAEMARTADSDSSGGATDVTDPHAATEKTYRVILRPGQPDRKQASGLPDKAAIEQWVIENGQAGDSFRCETRGPEGDGSIAVEEGIVRDGGIAWRIG